MMPLRVGWLILCYLLLASPAWGQRAGGPPGRYGGEKPAICSVSGTVTEAAEGGASPLRIRRPHEHAGQQHCRRSTRRR